MLYPLLHRKPQQHHQDSCSLIVSYASKAKLLRCVALFRLSLYNAHKKPSYSTIDEEKYHQLIADYDAALEGFSLTEAEAQLAAAKQIAKDAIANAQRKEKKQVEREMAEMIANCEDRLETARQREWLVSKFGTEGEYKDVLGLCKIATIDEISEKNYSLTPGAYVGVAEVEDDGVDFHERMNEIHTELASLNKEANELMSEIMKEWETLNTK